MVTNAEVMPQEKGDTFSRLKRQGQKLVAFLSGQILAQIFTLVAGILLVRSLTRTENAYYTIALTMQGAISVLADSGISSGLMSIGGKVWHDRYRFGQLISSALFLRSRMAAAAVAVVTPILIWMLVKNGAAPMYSVLLLVAVLTAVSAQLTTGVLEVVPRLHNEIGRMTKLEIVSATVRLVLVVLAYFTFLNAVVAVLAASIGLVVKNVVLRKYANEHIENGAPRLEEDQKTISKIIKQQSPNAIFFCVQGQITPWLMSLFGNTGDIADIGALGRLTIVLTLATSIMANIVSPRFAKMHSRPALLKFYLQTLVVFAAFSAALLLFSIWFPHPILWVLGPQYAHLQRELVIAMLSMIGYGAYTVTWALGTSKAWVQQSWLNIPLTVGTQMVVIALMGVSTTYDALLLSFISAVPGVSLNMFMAYYGYKHYDASHVSPESSETAEVTTSPA